MDPTSSHNWIWYKGYLITEQQKLELDIMYNDKPVFLHQVNVYGLSHDFIDRGMGDKYYEYHSKGFFGAVIRSEKPLQRINKEEVVVVVHARHSNGSFHGVNIDFIPKDSTRIDRYDIDPETLPLVDMQLMTNPGNIVINDQASLASLFFHDHQDKESVIINFVEK